MWEALGATGPADPENEEGLFWGTEKREGKSFHSLKDERAEFLCCSCSAMWVPHGKEEREGVPGGCVSPEPTVILHIFSGNMSWGVEGTHSPSGQA